MTRTKSSLKERYAKQNKYIEEHYDRTTITFPGGTKERIKALGTSVNSFVVNLVLEKLNELESGSAKAEKPIEEPKPVEKPVDDIPDLPFAEETPKKETAADQPKHRAKTQEEILEELDIYEKARRRGVVFTPDMTMEDLLKGMADDMPPSAAEANKNKDDLTFVGGSL